ncbi:hypothetical protein Droror1_Dr00014967 [Drosera rotundifolia]
MKMRLRLREFRLLFLDLDLVSILLHRSGRGAADEEKHSDNRWKATVVAAVSLAAAAARPREIWPDPAWPNGATNPEVRPRRSLAKEYANSGAGEETRDQRCREVTMSGSLDGGFGSGKANPATGSADPATGCAGVAGEGEKEARLRVEDNEQ